MSHNLLPNQIRHDKKQLYVFDRAESLGSNDSFYKPLVETVLTERTDAAKKAPSSSFQKIKTISIDGFDRQIIEATNNLDQRKCHPPPILFLVNNHFDKRIYGPLLKINERDVRGTEGQTKQAACKLFEMVDPENLDPVVSQKAHVEHMKKILARILKGGQIQQTDVGLGSNVEEMCVQIRDIISLLRQDKPLMSSVEHGVRIKKFLDTLERITRELKGGVFMGNTKTVGDIINNVNGLKAEIRKLVSSSTTISTAIVPSLFGKPLFDSLFQVKPNLTIVEPSSDIEERYRRFYLHNQVEQIGEEIVAKIKFAKEVTDAQKSYSLDNLLGHLYIRGDLQQSLQILKYGIRSGGDQLVETLIRLKSFLSLSERSMTTEKIVDQLKVSLEMIFNKNIVLFRHCATVWLSAQEYAF